MFEKPFVTISDPVYLPYTICIPEALEEENESILINRYLCMNGDGRREGGGRITSTISRMTAFNPGQIPPQVTMATITSAEL